MPPQKKMDQLHQDLARLGINPADLEVPAHQLGDSTRALARLESAQILQKKLAVRDRIKQRLVQSHESYLDRMIRARDQRVHRWVHRTSRSPYVFDLITDEQRIDEENKVRLREEFRKQKMAEKRREKVKQEIVMKALGETSDLDALRREKRAIIDEERRLKALLDLERNKLHTKEDYMAAVKAEKNRRFAKEFYARKQRIKMYAEERQEETKILKDFLDVPSPTDFTNLS